MARIILSSFYLLGSFLRWVLFNKGKRYRDVLEERRVTDLLSGLVVIGCITYFIYQAPRS